VDDGIDRDRGFTDLAVADDQFALAAADRHHRVDGLEADLYRLINRLTPDNAGRNFFDGVGQLVAERAFAIDRDTERIEYAAFQLGADRHFEDATGAFALLAFGDTEVIAENDGADRVALEVQRHAVAAAVEFDHLTVHDVGEAVDAHDTVRYGNDGALVLGLRRHIELVDALFDDFANLGWIQLLHVCSSIPSLRGTHCFWEIRISCRLCAQRFRQLFETSAHGAIDHHIAGADHYATDQVFVDNGADTDIALQLAAQRHCQTFGDVAGQRKRRGDFNVDGVFLVGLELIEQRSDLRQQRQALVGGQRAQEICGLVGQLVAEQIGQRLRLLRGRERRRLDHFRNLVAADHGGSQIQLPRPVRQGVLVAFSFG